MSTGFPRRRGAPVTASTSTKIATCAPYRWLPVASSVHGGWLAVTVRRVPIVVGGHGWLGLTRRRRRLRLHPVGHRLRQRLPAHPHHPEHSRRRRRPRRGLHHRLHLQHQRHPRHRDQHHPLRCRRRWAARGNVDLQLQHGRPADRVGRNANLPGRHLLSLRRADRPTDPRHPRCPDPAPPPAPATPHPGCSPVVNLAVRSAPPTSGNDSNTSASNPAQHAPPHCSNSPPNSPPPSSPACSASTSASPSPGSALPPATG